MLSYTELKKGVLFVYEGQPYEVIESGFLRMQQRKAVMQTKIRNLITGKILDRNWQASDEFEEADVERRELNFLYNHRDQYWFTNPKDPKERMQLPPEVLGDQVRFVKPNTPVTAWLFNGKVIKAKLPIKMEFVVKEAPPAIRGNTAQGGNKAVVLENGASLNTPLFINEGDTVRVNTETGEYVERVEKK
jgi:elongation factor P